MFENGASVSKIISELDRWVYDELVRISLHDLYQVDAGRQERSRPARQVLRASVDRVSRTVGIFRTDDLGATVAVHPLRNCRVGRVRTDPGPGCWPRRSSSTGCCPRGHRDHRVRVRERVDGLTDNYYRGFSVPVGEYVLQVQFAHDAVPARCYRFERRGLHAPDQGVRGVDRLDARRAPRGGVVPLGIVGMRWEWD